MKKSEKPNINTQKRKCKLRPAVAALSIMVAGTVAYNLMLPSYTLSKSTYCDENSHVHEETCWTKVLTCGLEESDVTENTYTETSETENNQNYGSELICDSVEHIHDDSCYDEWGYLICGQEEHIHDDTCYSSAITSTAENIASSAGHVHTDECYTNQLTCGHEEHEHTLSCYSNPSADIEEEDDWKESFEKAKLSDDVKANIVAIADTQINYKESTSNYEVVDEESETIRGITRYGQWYGKSYADWDAMFASFCLYYAGADFPLNNDAEKWLDEIKEKHSDFYQEAGSEEDSFYIPDIGDLIFIERHADEVDKDSDTYVTVGIVSEVKEKKETIKVIEGNYENQVKENKYDLDDESILGYAVIPVEERNEEDEVELPGSDESESEDIYADSSIENDADLLVTEEVITEDTTDDAVLTQNGDSVYEESSEDDQFEYSDGDGYSEEEAISEESAEESELENDSEPEAEEVNVNGVLLRAVDQNGNDLGDEYSARVDHDIDLSNLFTEYSEVSELEDSSIKQTINTAKEVELTGAKYETSYIYAGSFYGTEEVYAVGENWIEVAEGRIEMPYGAEIQLVYQEDRTQTVYTYEDDDVKVTATTSSADTFPDDAIFKVTEVTPESSVYNYEAYYNAAINAGASENMLLYDFAFYRPQANTWLSETEEEAVENLVQNEAENLPLTELQPENGGTVTFEITLSDEKLNEVDLTVDTLDVIHVPVNDEVIAEFTTTMEASVTDETDLNPELVDTQISNNTIIFTTNSLSVFSYTASELGSAKVAEALAQNKVTSADVSNTTMNLFDYWLTYRTYDDHNQYLLNSGINQYHALKFKKKTPDGMVGAYNGYTNSANPTQGIVKNLIGSDGYPVLNTLETDSTAAYGAYASVDEDGNTIYLTNESLSYLFNPDDLTNENVSGDGVSGGRKTFENADGLLMQDDDGYIWFDSNTNYAYFDENLGNFVLYNTPGISYTKNNQTYYQFFPFISPQIAFKFESNSPNGPYTLASSGVLANNMTNHYFGLTMNTTFYLTDDGQYNSKDMVFEFAGDDDVWIYIDDVLVGDIGGIHDRTTLNINFKDGNVIINGAAVGASGSYSTTIKQRFIDAYGSQKAANEAGYTFEGNTLKNDGKKHTLRMFYLERGNTASNLKMKWNLKPCALSVTKELAVANEEDNSIDEAESVLGNNEYTFVLSVNSNGTYVPVSGASYLISSGSSSTGPYSTTSEGVFTLKAGETAQFSGLNVGKQYKIMEKIPSDVDQYKYVEVSGTIQTEDLTGTQVEEDNFTGVTYYATVNKRNADLVFTNVVDKEKAGKLSIEKKLTTDGKTYLTDFNKPFTVSVTLTDNKNNSIVTPGQSVTYTVSSADSSNQSESVTETALVSEDGSIPIKVYPGYISTIDNILVGTRYRLSETTTGYQATLSSNSGTIQKDNDGNFISSITVTNRPNTIRIIKISDDDSPVRLPGVQFQLKDDKRNLVSFNEEQITSDDISSTLYFVDSNGATDLTTAEDGTLNLYGLAPGTYYLSELHAKDGYNKMESTIKVIIDENGGITATEEGGNKNLEFDSDSGVLTIVNNKGIKLPETGGPGPVTYLVIGTIVLLSSFAAWVIYERKIKRI